ncbi:MAG: PLP-dependent aminotransferase family protein [Sphingomonas sp.]|uniref:MocR-like pyridoxine biosynthesis transcription factor PdxR n=1 Tax=Sphingomonas sp. TaxID=28214 RepID=UPI001853F32E|nr:PLP-dependent aminotransferase family protein [Sphingomonas sp.]MBA3667833.1 PLP-dependent aminotransferase family protein [Sphingomonas sp.]
MDFLFELNLPTAPEGSRDVSGTLYRELKAAIINGRLVPGIRLPSTRKAPAILHVSRNTAQDVYERLAHDGLVSARRGSGTYVASPDYPVRPSGKAAQNNERDHRLRDFWLRNDVASALGFWHEISEPSLPSRIDLRPALIDPKLFPFAIFRQGMAKQLRLLETRPSSFKSPQGNQGSFQLRHCIAEHIALTRAVACHHDDVLVTSGAQQAFDLIARTLVEPGKTIVAVEDPGYPPMRVAFMAAGAELVPVPVDEEGIIVDAIPPGAGIICVCPSHQFPLGMSTSPARRRALIELARSRGAVIVEDDYDGEFRYDGSPIQALRTEASNDVIFYVGTFSKCMLPSLRLGFIVPPPWALRSLIAAKNCIDWHCPVPIQMSVAAFIRDGHLARHVRRMRRIYRGRRDLLLRLMGGNLAQWFRPIPSYYGMHVTALAEDIDCEAISAQLAGRGVQLHSLHRYHLGTERRNGLVFGYGTANEEHLRQVLHDLRELAGRF